MACGVLNFLTKREWKPADFLPSAAPPPKPAEKKDGDAVMRAMMAAFPPPPGYLEMVEKRMEGKT